MSIDTDATSKKSICYGCIGESYLSSIVFRVGKRHTCSYCRKSRKSISIDEMADRIEKAFHQHYRRTSDQPDSYQYAALADKESVYEWFRDGEPAADAIMNSADIPINAASDIQEILSDRHADIESYKMGEECEFDSDAHYVEILPSDQLWRAEWYQFEESLKYEARYFNRAGAERLGEIFRDIDRLLTHDGRSIVVAAGGASKLVELYRARVFQSDEKLREAMERPDIHMANPPPTLAAAGRMNARGISTFYGATDTVTAIAEVRPPVGSQVLVAKFTIEKDLRLLDLTALDSVFENGSIFDEGWAARLERASFLNTLSQIMTRAVMPDDEALEYLPTQAIADFLASENIPTLDGILFPSVQTEGEGLNVVLFQRAARVAALEIPDGASTEARTGMMGEDGWEPDYYVNEIRRRRGDSGNLEYETTYNFPEEVFPSHLLLRNSILPATLKVDAERMFVHIVRKVHYECNEHAVQRFQIERTENNV